MDAQEIQQVIGWVQQEFQGKQQVSKDELVSHAQNANIPQDAKGALNEVPQGTYDKDQLIGQVRDTMMQKAGGMGGMAGGMGGMMGGGGQR